MILLLVGCDARVSAGEGITSDVPAPADYDRAVRDATRELRLYDGLATALLLRATRLDVPFVETLEAERAHLLLLEPDAREAHLAAAKADAAATHTFVLSADSQWRQDLRFGFDEGEPWRVRAFVDGRPCTPLDATEIKRPTALDLRLYPHHTHWAHLWNVRFQTDCGTDGKLVLQLTGPHGTGEVGWQG